ERRIVTQEQAGAAEDAPVLTTRRQYREPHGLRRVLPDGMPQLPLPAFALPQVRRAELLGECHERLARHGRLGELRRRSRELVGRNAEIAEHLVGEALGELAVEAFDQRYAFVPRDVTGADLLGGVIGRAADAELHVRGVVVEVVDAIIDRVVFAVGAGRALR